MDVVKLLKHIEAYQSYKGSVGSKGKLGRSKSTLIGKKEGEKKHKMEDSKDRKYEFNLDTY